MIALKLDIFCKQVVDYNESQVMVEQCSIKMVFMIRSLNRETGL